MMAEPEEVGSVCNGTVWDDEVITTTSIIGSATIHR